MIYPGQKIEITTSRHETKLLPLTEAKIFTVFKFKIGFQKHEYQDFEALQGMET